MDNAIYGESYLYDIHSKKYGDIPNIATEVYSQKVKLCFLVNTYNIIIPEIDKKQLQLFVLMVISQLNNYHNE